MRYSYGTSRLIPAVVLLAMTIFACSSSASPAATAVRPPNDTPAPLPADTDTPAPLPGDTAAAFPTRTLAAPQPSLPKVTPRPFQADKLLWNFAIGAGETGSWCEYTPGKGYQWIQDLILAAAQGYSNPNSATGQFSVGYHINGHAAGSPDGVTINYDSTQKVFCIQVSGPIPAGEYAIQYFLDIVVESPIDFPQIPEKSKYLLMKVLPAVDFSKPADTLLALTVWGSSGGIALFNPDEPAFTRIANGEYLIGPSWSPDGARIVYSVLEEDGIYVINADGSGQAGSMRGYYPGWSQDGQQLALVSANSDVSVANLDGSGIQDLTAGESPQWSPVASEIAYLQNNGELWLMNADGSNPVNLASGVLTHFGVPGQDAEKDFAWSPDGSKIAFVNQTGILTVINKDGSSPLSLANVGQLRNSSNRAIQPIWSPDGSQIALDCDGLCIAGLDGTLNKVVDNYDVNSLAWSHDGTRLYFSEWHGGILRYDLASGKVTPLLANDFAQYNDLSLRPNP